MRRQQPSGFAILEVLIVFAILGVITTIAFFSLGGRHTNQQFESFANNLGQLVSLAGERAMMQPVEVGVSVADNTLQFATYRLRDDEKKEKLIPLKDTLLGKQKIPQDVQVNIQVDGKQPAKQSPQIIIAANGDMTPFTITVGKKGEKPSYMIKGDAEGNVTHKWLA